MWVRIAEIWTGVLAVIGMWMLFEALSVAAVTQGRV